MFKRNILICGATGFIGRNVLEYFGSLENTSIRAVYHIRKPYDVSNLPADIEWVKADLRSPSDVENIMKGVSIVIQAAATTSGAKDIVTKPYIHVTDNAVMNSLLLRAAYHNDVKHFIFFSCTVMYQSSNRAIKENDYNPSTSLHDRYFGVGHTKLYIEKMLEFFSSISGMKTTAIRHSNVYGPFDKFDFERSHVFGASISKVMLAAREVTVWGTGEEERDLLHINDLCRFVKKVISNQKNKFGLFNCGCGKKISVRDLTNKIIEKSGKKLEIKYDTSKPTIKTSLFLDCNLALNELNWKPKLGIDEGIIDTISWWKKNIDVNNLELKR